jgi:hypothetical protein
MGRAPGHPRPPRSLSGCTCSSIWWKPSSRCSTRIRRLSQPSMMPSLVRGCPWWTAPSLSPSHPRYRPDRSRRSCVGPAGSSAINRCGRGGSKAGRAMPSPPIWASARVQCGAIFAPPPGQSARAALTGAAVSSRPINRIAEHGGTPAAVMPCASMARANSAAILAARPPSPVTLNAGAKRRARPRGRGHRGSPSRSWPRPTTRD